MNERLKEIRKHIGKTQKDFGAMLGVSRDTYASYESGRVVPNDTFIQLLCSLFNVNENWLRTGDGEMLEQSSQTILDELVKTHNLNEKETAIIEAFLDLSSEGRAAVINYIENVSNKMSSVQTSRNELISGNIAATEKKIQEATAKKEV